MKTTLSLSIFHVSSLLYRTGRLKFAVLRTKDEVSFLPFCKAKVRIFAVFRHFQSIYRCLTVCFCHKFSSCLNLLNFKFLISGR